MVIILIICIALVIVFRSKRVKMGYTIWKHTKLYPWFKRHKDSWFFKYLERANWFRWYGRRVVHVKPKDSSKLSATEKDVKAAIVAKDYQRALEIVKGLPVTEKTVALRQVIEAKLK